MKITVVVAYLGDACNVGGPITHKRVTFDLTPEQEAEVRRVWSGDKWESVGPVILEPGAKEGGE